MALCDYCHRLWHHFHSSHVIVSRAFVLSFLNEKRANPPLAVRGFDKKKAKSPRPQKEPKQPKQPKQKKGRSLEWHVKHAAKCQRRKQNKPLRKYWCKFMRELPSRERLTVFINELTAYRDRMSF